MARIHDWRFSIASCFLKNTGDQSRREADNHGSRTNGAAMRQQSIRQTWRQLRSLKWAELILIFLFLLPAIGRAEAPDSGIRIDFPASDSLPYDKFGVFIGIDRYSNLPPE